ncbi:aconitate hydratase AcnA [Psychromonas antarctica]|uniref:aconitate hydratase AcnA n=1 Tax=Psychromonas antarctica TaxID=67573 RepID=UPI001EE8DA86|nr:aconitate hydratase AcnA [Psychromonas antarctica]MCG6202206.1 aconitate hydratase AcnA [Psychromonas antarctica]
MIPKNEVEWRERYLDTLSCAIGKRRYWSLPKLAEDFQFTLSEQPLVTRLFMENVQRHYAGENATPLLIKALCAGSDQDLPLSYYPSRVLMQDYTGVPAIADLAAMRDAVAEAGGDPQKINPSCPVDLVIDHSVIVDQAGDKGALSHNRKMEMTRNQERYQFLKWAQQSFDNLTVVPPGRGICHQVNLEYFAQVVRDDAGTLIPDTLVGTDSHTTMINGLGVLGWGVGGIEAEAVMLGQPLSLNLPQIVGVKLDGELPLGTTATDLVLTVTQRLRKHGVVGKFVEFYGPGISKLSVADRATIANMAPEYGATCGLFPIDERVLDYLQLTNRPDHIIEQVRAYAMAQGLWHDETMPDPIYAENIAINLSDIESSLAGPRRPQDRLVLSAIKAKTQEEIELLGHQYPPAKESKLSDGDVVIAAITSCTNTSNPHVMLQAGLLAKAAVEKGLLVQPHVKTSLAPGSQVVARYLDDAGLQPYLDQLGFQRVGFGCTTCIGNSGPLNNNLERLIEAQQLSVSAVLSGNRNFEGRIHPSVRLNWLASPPLVVAFALVGHTRIDLDSEPLGQDKNGDPVFLRDIWPSEDLMAEALKQVTRTLYKASYQNMQIGDQAWEDLAVEKSVCYPWNERSTYIRKPPFFDLQARPPVSALSAQILAVLGDSITTDHISPAGQISQESPAGAYLIDKQVKPEAFNSYGARRGNHEVMVRGTFANKRIKNKMVEPHEGGFTRVFGENAQSETILPIYDASQYYQQREIPLVIFAGKEYGSGSSRDWAAKGCLLLNVKAVIAESYERIHRSNLVGMGILPLQLPANVTVDELQLVGDEAIILEWEGQLTPGQPLTLIISPSTGEPQSVSVLLRIENQRELDYFLAGGVLPYVAKQYTQTP